MKLGLFLAAAALLGGSVCGTAAAVAAGCTVGIRTTVSLVSDPTDPNVFVFETKDELVDYVSEHWNNSSEIFKHTILAPPGTPARVNSCSPKLAHPRYSPPVDVVNVTILGGPFRGKSGWVTSADMHVRVAATPAKGIVGQRRQPPAPRP